MELLDSRLGEEVQLGTCRFRSMFLWVLSDAIYTFNDDEEMLVYCSQVALKNNGTVKKVKVSIFAPEIIQISKIYKRNI